MFRVRLVAIVAVTTAVLSGCQWLLSNAGPVPTTVRSEVILLAWDATASPIPDQPSSVDHYEIHYRPFGTVRWQFLHDTPGGHPGTTIGSWELAYGSYEFAVREVYANGEMSALHGSSDFSAWPPGGWYVIWQAP